MLDPAVFNTSMVCHQYGVNHAVVSPGSRNAPLTISFARNDSIKKWIIPDERSAAFIALGIAQKTKQPVALVCTSGTAMLNYAPAIAEAYYREIPLIVLSADRPPELIDQRDGQTIRQFEALKNHVIKSFQLPVVIDRETSNTYTLELVRALQTLSRPLKGPIHINVPFREPFYPTNNQELAFGSVESVEQQEEINSIVLPEIDLEGKKVLILCGQKNYNESARGFFESAQRLVPVLHSPLSNLPIEGITNSDLFLKDQQELKPDTLITTGLSVLSKSVKTFLKNHKPKEHFHFDPAGIEVDTYETNPILVKNSIHLSEKALNFTSVAKSYLKEWKSYENKTTKYIQGWTPQNFNETLAAKVVLASIPSNIQLHLSNSMPVRYAELFGVEIGTETWSNRGTSGIDGCTSTAVGSSLVDTSTHLLITGDLAFHYDRNAFFNNYNLPNLRIIVFNNMGGGIFRLIDGPSQLPELEEYFETRHERTAKYICEENNIVYNIVESEDDLSSALRNFFDHSDECKLIEIKTRPEINQKEFKAFKSGIHE